jgi:hypothetical protein
MVPLTDICDGCAALVDTKRQPTLVGVDPVRMNPLNNDCDEGLPDCLDEADTTELEENDDFAEDVDDVGGDPLEELSDLDEETDEGPEGGGSIRA